MKLLRCGVLYNCSLLLISGCATLYGNNNHKISVDSFPHGAYVIINNIDYGITPLSVILTNINDKIILRKIGYKDYFISIHTKFQKQSYWDILFPPLFLVDWSLGNLESINIDNKSFNIYLKKEVEK